MFSDVRRRDVHVYAGHWNIHGIDILRHDWDRTQRFDTHCEYRRKSLILHSDWAWNVRSGRTHLTIHRLLLRGVHLLLCWPHDVRRSPCLLRPLNSWKTKKQSCQWATFGGKHCWRNTKNLSEEKPGRRTRCSNKEKKLYRLSSQLHVLYLHRRRSRFWRMDFFLFCSQLRDEQTRSNRVQLPFLGIHDHLQVLLCLCQRKSLKKTQTVDFGSNFLNRNRTHSDINFRVVLVCFISFINNVGSDTFSRIWTVFSASIWVWNVTKLPRKFRVFNVRRNGRSINHNVRWILDGMAETFDAVLVNLVVQLYTLLGDESDNWKPEKGYRGIRKANWDDNDAKICVRWGYGG